MSNRIRPDQDDFVVLFIVWGIAALAFAVGALVEWVV